MSQVILITGASSGLGKAAAELLIARGHVVYGASRHPAQEKVGFHPVLMDVTDQQSVEAAMKEIIAKEGRIDVLVNNAGMGVGGALENFSSVEVQIQFETNFFGMARLTSCVLPYMREKKSGKIINISSIGGLMGLPFQGHYSAAKFAVEGFSEALFMEVKPFNIKVIVVNPGDFKTGFTSNRIFTAKDTGGGDYGQRFKKAVAVIEKDEQGGSDPSVLGRTIEKIVRTKNPKFRYIAGRFDQRLIARLKPFLPHSLMAWILSDHYKVG
ncbi:MAG: SDR family NAD(P)-dependent oxidoreductase [Bacteroidales bacterium]|jgi:NAD(P)-dependent dehydrogenase (short-subunit alcohol dehydrogenase family)